MRLERREELAKGCVDAQRQELHEALVGPQRPDGVDVPAVEDRLERTAGELGRRATRAWGDHPVLLVAGPRLAASDDCLNGDRTAARQIDTAGRRPPSCRADSMYAQRR